MKKTAIIEQLRSQGAIAAHPLDRWVSTVKGQPQKVTMANPLFMDKKKLKTGDKVAIVNTRDYSSAFICRIQKIEYGSLSNTEILDLSVVKKINLT